MISVTGTMIGGTTVHVGPMTNTDAPARPRKTPCASCPYRQNVPSGVWHEDEYAKLERYDAETGSQPAAVFMCHQGAGDVCAGWLGHTDPAELLAVRIGIISGSLDESCATYETDVPLFASGAEAAAHGRAAIKNPDDRAVQAIRKIVQVRAHSAIGQVQIDAC